MARRKKTENPAPGLRRFVLVRHEDVHGVSGTGVVAEGCRLSSGEAVLHWTGQLTSIATYHSIDVLVAVHGHDGRTVVQWIDADPMAGTEGPKENP